MCSDLGSFLHAYAPLEVWDKPADYKITYVSASVVTVFGVLFYTTKRQN